VVRILAGRDDLAPQIHPARGGAGHRACGHNYCRYAGGFHRERVSSGVSSPVNELGFLVDTLKRLSHDRVLAIVMKTTLDHLPAKTLV
jgi:hypothetical protein